MDASLSRPSRSQQGLLTYISAFVAQHGYGPSYREIMQALEYKSVSTVAAHVNGLIAKGKLVKHGRSARSLEVIAATTPSAGSSEDYDGWLAAKISDFIRAPHSPEEAAAILTAMRALGLPKARAAAEQAVKAEVAP